MSARKMVGSVCTQHAHSSQETAPLRPDQRSRRDRCPSVQLWQFPVGFIVAMHPRNAFGCFRLDAKDHNT